MAVVLTPQPPIPLVLPAGQLPVTLRASRPISDEALYAFCAANRDLRIERNAAGELIIMSPTGGETGHRNFTLIMLFGVWATKNGQGLGFDSSTGFVLPNGAERAPDLSWVRRGRWEAIPPAERKRFVPLCPDFVVELMSPSDVLEEVQAKMLEYLQNGAQLGWLIVPEEKAAFVYRPGVEAIRVAHPEVLSGEPELPGFQLDLSALG